MDAQKPNLEVSHVTPLVVRLAGAWLAIVLAVGLWQGYGQWLLSGGAGDVF